MKRIISLILLLLFTIICEKIITNNDNATTESETEDISTIVILVYSFLFLMVVLSFMLIGTYSTDDTLQIIMQPVDS